MNTQKITKHDLVTLYHSDSCSKWRSIIDKYLDLSKHQFDAYEIEIDPQDIKTLIHQGSRKQKELVVACGIKLISDTNVFIDRSDNLKLVDMAISEFNRIVFAKSVLEITGTHEGFEHLRRNSFYINSDFTVKLHTLNCGSTLIEIHNKEKPVKSKLVPVWENEDEEDDDWFFNDDDDWVFNGHKV